MSGLRRSGGRHPASIRARAHGNRLTWPPAFADPEKAARAIKIARNETTPDGIEPGGVSGSELRLQLLQCANSGAELPLCERMPDDVRRRVSGYRRGPREPSGGYFGSVLVRKCVAPMRAFIVPNGCSTVSRRWRMACGFASRRCCTASSRCSCSHRGIRRSGPVVHASLSEQS